MSRRSTCLQGTSVQFHPDNDDIVIRSDEDSLEVEEEPEYIPTKKRRKAAKSTVADTDEDKKTKKVRGRRGILSSLREFPLDVLFEIFGQLNPKDLINLSRTTKELRGILMNRSNLFIWKNSRAQVEGLPEIPRDLNEPQYAALAFDGHCHKCLTTPVQTVIWTARMRLCKKCIQEDFVPVSTLEAETRLESALINLVPLFEDRHRFRRRGSHANLFYSLSFATKLKEETACYRTQGILRERTPGYAEWFKGKSEKMQEMQAVSEPTSYVIHGSHVRWKHAKLCAAWLENRKNDRTDELDEARRLRREGIVERLTALGWGEEIPHHLEEIESHKLVRQPKELTDRIWKNIEAPLVEFLTGLKKTRLEIAHTRIIQERRELASQVYKTFRETFPADTVFPANVDMISPEPFRAIIEDTSINPEVKVTEETFAAALLQVPDFSAKWRRSKDEELVEIMKTMVTNSTKADLHLATTFFRWSTSSEAVGYPQILVCSSAIAFSSYEYTDETHTLRQALRENPWNAKSLIRFNIQASLNVRAVVEACGLDPDVTTAAEMDEINPAMECLACNDVTYGRLIMRWIQTANHSCATPSWRCLKPDDELRVEAQEKKVFTAAARSFGYASSSWRANYCCKFCDIFPKITWNELEVHLLTTHKIDQISLEMVKHSLGADISTRFPRPLRLKPPVVEAENKEAGTASGASGGGSKEAANTEALALSGPTNEDETKEAGVSSEEVNI
ncbi:hypothetical protein C8F04DRAFT_1395128 [Mycena alexandri]|uniref:F-box domain-containing protein n=1 Tax=Mycena alexandri TaxID=1745969 RepID=A0AAD6X395_9AGAR|nr:hypothetical protein C8F04DRAFT_1395128 [Mycena alexandri]